MFSIMKKVSVLAGLALAVSAPAAAKDTVALSGKVQVERTITENGETKKVLVAPEGVVPGDRLLFATSYENAGSEAVENFVVTNPLPSAIRLADADPTFDVSVDGGKTFGNLASLQVDEPEKGLRAAEARDVTHIRWTLKRLEPGVKGSLNYYGIVR